CAGLGGRGERPYGKSEGTVLGRIRVRVTGELNYSVKFIEKEVFCINQGKSAVADRVRDEHTTESRLGAPMSQFRVGAELTRGCVRECLLQQSLSGDQSICRVRKCKIVRRVVAAAKQGYAGPIEKLNVIKDATDIHIRGARQDPVHVDLKRDSMR